MSSHTRSKDAPSSQWMHTNFFHLLPWVLCVGCTTPWVQPTCFLSRAHLMSMSLMFLIYSSSCTKVSISNWVGWLRRVQHAEERKERSKRHGHSGMAETSKAIRPMRAKERDFGWSKVKVSGLHLLWLDVKSVKGRKEGKDEEINREAIRPMQRWRKEVKVPKCED